MLEPLSQALGVSLLELMQGKRQETETLTVAEADAAVSQAMSQLERTTARRYLRLFQWYLTATSLLCLLWLTPVTTLNLMSWAFAKDVTLWSVFVTAPALPDLANIGVIGGADGPTAILTASRPLTIAEALLEIGVPLLLLIICVVLAVRVRRLEKRLK